MTAWARAIVAAEWHTGMSGTARGLNPGRPLTHRIDSTDWQAGMQTIGYGGTTITATTGWPDLTTVSSGRTLEDDLARADARRVRYLRPLPPAPVPAVSTAPRQVRARTTPKPKPDRRRARVQPRQDWVDLYGQGYTINRIAAQSDSSHVTVRAHLTRAGIPLRDDRKGCDTWKNRRRPLTPQQLADAAAAYAAGASIADVAAQLHVRHATAREALEQTGVKVAS